MKLKIVATPANNVHLGSCIMISVLLDDGKEALVLVKTKTNSLVVCKRNEKIFFEMNDFGDASEIPLRISDACVTGSLGDTACSCHVDSINYLKRMKKYGIGVFVYLPHEGMGRGLSAKLSDHRLQIGLGIGGKDSYPMSFEESMVILFKDSRYDSRIYKDVGTLFNQIGLGARTFLYFGENIRKIEAIKMQTGLRFVMNKEYIYE